MSELPKHWQRLRLKYAATLNDEVLSEETGDDYELQYIDIGDVNSNGEITGQTAMRFENAPSRARRKVRDNDVIVSTVRTYLTAIAPIISPPENLIVSTGFAVVRPNSKLDGRYCKYALRSASFVDEVVKRSVGVSYPAITSSELADITICVPPLEEQRAIAAHLDRETARLDELRAEKEHFLQLLERKRAALIAHAVTGRLNLVKALSFKASGVEWLGDVPEHWEVVRLKFKLKHQMTPERAIILQEADEVSFLPMEYISEQGDLDLSYIKPRDEIGSGYTLIFDGDVVVAKITPCFENGKGALIEGLQNGVGFGTTELHVLTPGPQLDSRFLLYITQSPDFRSRGEGAMTGSAGQKRVPGSFIGNFRLPFPPLDEQRAIVAYLERMLNEMDALKAALLDSLELLSQRRAALIAAAVTGRLQLPHCP